MGHQGKGIIFSCSKHVLGGATYHCLPALPSPHLQALDHPMPPEAFTVLNFLIMACLCLGTWDHMAPIESITRLRFGISRTCCRGSVFEGEAMCGGPRPSLLQGPALHLLIRLLANHGGLTMEGQLPGQGDERGRPNGPKGSFAFKLSMIYLHKRRGSARRLF